MRIIGLFTVAAVMIFSCAAVAQKENLKISGTIKGLEKGYAELYSDSNISKWEDSVAIERGKFTLSCNMDIPQLGYLYVKDMTGKTIYISQIFIGEGDIEVNADIASSKELNILNAPLNDEYVAFSEYVTSIPQYKENNKLSAEINKFFKAGDKQKVRELSEKKKELIRNMIDSIFLFRRNGDRNLITAYNVCHYASYLSVKEKIELSNKFSPTMKNSYYLNQFIQEIEREKSVAVGCRAPNFKAKDLSGREYSLADFEGKYLFLEFSASWCGWCKREIPFIREAYNSLKGKDIVFVTMNMDTARDKWEGDVAKENIEWLCLSNLQGMNSELANSYNVRGIPACFVIDPSGIIIKKDIRGKEIMECLSTFVK